MADMSGLRDFITQYNLPEILLIAVVIMLYIIRFLFDLFLYGRASFSKDLRIRNSRPSFSVLVPVRNEDENLRKNLPDLLACGYLSFEVVAVDDFSQDQSYTILGLLKEKFRHLRFSGLNQEMRHSSKHAINIGLKAAQNDWVILTDPAVENFSGEWLNTFADKVVPGKSMVLGYNGISRKKGFFNRLFRMESFFQQFQGFAFYYARAGFVVEQKNIAFLKKLYFEKGGFAGQMNDEYLDLERLLNKYLRKKQAALNLTADGVSRKKQAAGRKELKDLVIKSIHVKKKLNLYQRLLLFFDGITRLLMFPLTVVFLVLFPELLTIAGIVIVCKLLFHMYIIFNMQNRLKEEKIFISSLIYELIMPFYRMMFFKHYISSLRKRRWNSN